MHEARAQLTPLEQHQRPPQLPRHYSVAGTARHSQVFSPDIQAQKGIGPIQSQREQILCQAAAGGGLKSTDQSNSSCTFLGPRTVNRVQGCLILTVCPMQIAVLKPEATDCGVQSLILFWPRCRLLCLPSCLCRLL